LALTAADCSTTECEQHIHHDFWVQAEAQSTNIESDDEEN